MVKRSSLLAVLVITGSLSAPLHASWQDVLAKTSMSSLLPNRRNVLATTVAAITTAWLFWPSTVHARWGWPTMKPAQPTQPLTPPLPTERVVTEEELTAVLNNWRSFHVPGHAIDEPFLIGAGTSSLQVDDGHGLASAWNRFAQQKINNGEMKDEIQVLPGVGCKAQEFYKDDVKRIKELGATVYRFSTSWSLVQPHGPENWDNNVIRYYQNLCDELVKAGIKPAITLHHYDDPQWFLDQYQGFETEEGIQAYVKYCSRLYEALADRGVHLWFTFNAPEAYAINGYMMGTRPPGINSFVKGLLGNRVRNVTWNLLEAHRRVYEAFHERYNTRRIWNYIPEPRVGILKNMYQVDPWVYDLGAVKITSPIDKFAAWLPYWLQDQLFFKYFAKNAKCLDFIGLNYYSHGWTKNTFSPTPDPYEQKTNNKRYTVSAEGIHRALHTINDNIARPLNIPIYVAENGIAAGNDDVLRATFIKQYLYAITRAIQEGIPVKGYMYWSLMDNYEWGIYSKHYGLYEVDRSIDPNTGEPRLTRRLRDGAKPFVDTAKAYTQGYEKFVHDLASIKNR